MDKEDLEKKLDPDEQKAREILDRLLEGAKNIEDLNEIHCLIEDYLEQGYKFREYVNKYNQLVQAFFPSNSV